MICLVYCLPSSSKDIDDDEEEDNNNNVPVPVPLPFNSDLETIVYQMNKILPPDVRIMDASPTPIRRNNSGDNRNDNDRPFHPSLDAISKTYRYMFGIGDIHDPIRTRYVICN